MKTRRSILSLIFGAAAAPAAVAVAKAMPEAEVVGTIRRLHVSQLSERALADTGGGLNALQLMLGGGGMPMTSWRLLDESDLRYHGVPISIIDEHLQEVLND